VNEDILQAELGQVTSELVAARTEYASLGAKIAGMAARQSALRKALDEIEPAGGTVTTPAQKYRTDAIVAVLEKAGTSLPIKDVVAGLRNTGRPEEAYDNVSVDLAYLAEKGRIVRVRRGTYATAVQHRSIQKCPNQHEFTWQPAPGVCPYCSLSSTDRIEGLRQTEASTACPPDCCLATPAGPAAPGAMSG
jgi:hypothetical protein